LAKKPEPPGRQLTGPEAAVMRHLGAPVQAGKMVHDLRSEGFDTDHSVRALLDLQSEKLVALEEAKPYVALSSYALSPLSLWFWVTMGAVALSLGLISATSGAALYLRYVFGSVLVLFLPGYSLIEALYPKRELDELTRLALSIGLSLALVPLIGLVLNYTPWGIRLAPVAVSIAGVTVALSMVALKRKHDYYRLSRGV